MPDNEPEEFPIEESVELQTVSPGAMKPLVDEKGLPVEDSIRNLLHHNKVPHLKEIVDEIVDEWGGAKEFARALKETYDAAPKGGNTRARILERVFNLMQLFVDEGGEEEFDEETLLAVLMETMKGTVDVVAEPSKILVSKTGGRG